MSVLNQIPVKTRRLMGISGIMGATFFIIANAHLLKGYELTAGYIQISINYFVFLSWGRGFLQTKGVLKVLLGIFTAVPVCMATFTVVNLFIPYYRAH